MPIVTTSSRRRAHAGIPPSPFRIALALAALVAASCVALHFLKRGWPAPSEEPAGDSTPSAAARPQSGGDPVPQPPEPISDAAETSAAPDPPQRPDTPTSAAPDSAAIPPSADPPAPVGGIHVTNEVPRDPDNPDLNSGFGQMLSMLQSVELGDDPTPFPDPYGEDETGDEDFAASETNDVVIVEGESPDAERRKEAVAWAKVDIREYLKAGGRAKDALQELYAYQKECAKLRTDAADDFREWLKENPKDEEVLSALEEFNGKLKAEGIKQLTVEEILPFEEEEEEANQ